jgi:squalene cyclase
VEAIPTLEALCSRLEAAQDPNGGWGFRGGQIALEPTCFAVLALLGASSVQANRGAQWIKKHRNRDGSWPAFDDDDLSGCWTTSLALLALLSAGQGGRELRDTVIWLVSDLPREAHWIWRWRFRTVDTRVNFDPEKFGWSWAAGTTSWVIPTAFAIIALKRSRDGNLDLATRIDHRIDRATEMLLDRMCPEGGWNSGNGVVFGVPVAAHLDATAIALLALRSHCRNSKVERGLRWLVRAVRGCPSPYSLAWAIMALHAYEDCDPGSNELLHAAMEELLALINGGVAIDDRCTLATTMLALQTIQGTCVFEEKV